LIELYIVIKNINLLIIVRILNFVCFQFAARGVHRLFSNTSFDVWYLSVQYLKVITEDSIPPLQSLSGY